MSAWMDEVFAALERVPQERAAAVAPDAGTSVFGRGDRDASEEGVRSAEITLVLSTDPFAGELTIVRAKLANVTEGDPSGRLDADESTYADLELEIADDSARAAARRLFAGPRLGVRWVLEDGSWFDVDRSSGGLEVASEENLRWSVRLPASWLERDRRLGELLASTVELAFAAAEPRT